MYTVDQSFADLSDGAVVRWNGVVRAVEEVGDDYAVIEGETLSKYRINNMLKSHDTPFEVVN